MIARLAAYRQAITTARAVYADVLGRPVDDEGLAETLRRQLDDDATRADLVAWLEASREYRDAHPDPAAPAPTRPAPLPPLAGRLRVEGDTYVDDAGPRVPIALHAGDLALAFCEGRGDDVEAAFTEARAAGYQILRTWTSIGWHQRHRFWGDRQLDPNDAETRRRLTEFFRIGSEDHGLAFHVALGDADAPRDAIRAYFDWLAGLVAERPHWFALVEAVNEAAHNGAPDADEVASWIAISRARNPETLHVLSAAAGAGASEEVDQLRAWTPTDQRIYVVHASRANHWYDQARHAFSTGYKRAPRRLGWSGEPPGMQWPGHTGVSSMTHAHEWTAVPWRYAFYCAQTAVARQVPTFMCSHGVILPVGGRFADAPGFGLAPRLISDLPPDIQGYDRLIHGGSTWRDVRVFEAPAGIRVDQAIDSATGRAVLTIYPDEGEAPTRDVEIPVARAWRGRVHSPLGYVDVVLAAGDRWPVDATNGLRLVGQILE